MHCFLPAIMQGTTQDFGAAEVASPPPSAPSAAVETDAEAWLGDLGRSYASYYTFSCVPKWWCVVGTQLGTPSGRYDEHSTKFPSVVNQGLIGPVGESQTSEGWWSLASRQLRTIYMVPRLGLCFAPAATWNLHTIQPRTLPQLTMRLSISPVCYKQRIKRIKW
jgi:hypothetical protein